MAMKTDVILLLVKHIGFENILIFCTPKEK